MTNKLFAKNRVKPFLLSVILFFIYSTQAGAVIQDELNLSMDRQISDFINSDKAEIEVILTFNRFVDMNAKTNIRALLNKDFRFKSHYTSINAFSGTITKNGLQKLKLNPYISHIYFDEIEYPTLAQSTLLINASELWNVGYNGTGETICVIDSGVDYTHPALGACTTTQFLSGSCSKILGGYDYYNSDSDPMDDNGHGTHVAAIAASTNLTYRGIAPSANIVALKVCGKSGEGCPVSNQLSAIEWCVNNKTRFNISVITISIGGTVKYTDYCNDDVRTSAINNATAESIFVDIASGNAGWKDGISKPACIQNATSIGAIDKYGKVSTYSNRYKNLDLLAPGGEWGNPNDPSPYLEIVSAYSTNVSNDPALCFIKDSLGNCYDDDFDVPPNFIRSVGTSMAAPHVAGAAALLQHAYNGSLNPLQIRQALNFSGKQIWDSQVKTGFFFWQKGKYFPLIDVKKAIDYIPLLDILHTDWPTDHHDFRRTGFTLLKGDVNKASDIDASNVALKDTISSDILIRPSVSDIDGNGHQDVVTVMYELGGSGNSDVYAVERRDRVLDRWWMQTKERWHLSVPVSYPLLPPTLANIDSDSSKEVLVGVRNGTLVAYDVASSGNSVSEKWRYKFSEKYTAVGGANIIDYGGGTAVADVDLDGNNEVITADFGTRTSYDWPGEVFVFDGATGAKEGNATFGNGGAFASVSVANVDSDDNPEIIVPSFYGVFVYDYNASAPNKLTKKCDTTGDGGLIDDSVVVYDVDRDNQYELIYTSANQLCHASKTCSNKLYIKNAQTCANKGPSPISLSVYSRVTPTIANLDSDSNYEIVISGRLNTQTEDGKIIAYDASTGAQQWSYDDSGTLKTAFVAPDIADMNGDGKYDIVFGENNGTKVHIVNSSGGKNFTYNFNAFIDSALAIADIDNDGKAEIALKREGSPYGILAVAGSFNRPPQLGNISNRTARAGELIDLNVSGELVASDPDGNNVTFSFSSPFNSSGKWQTTVNDTGNYSLFVEVSDGSLTDFAFVDVYVFNQSTKFVGNFSDGSSSKLLNYAAAGNNTVSIRLPKNATIGYSRIRLEGRGS